MTDYAAFVLSYARAGRVQTVNLLRRKGYTGRIVIVVGDDDPQLEQYRNEFGDQLAVFSKRDYIATDCGDNFGDMRTPLYARNACFDIAERLGLACFIVLDDDYTGFEYRSDSNGRYVTKALHRLDAVFAAMRRFLESCPNVATLAMAQGGDFIGGAKGSKAQKSNLLRKAMNSFMFLSSSNSRFVSRLNDDVSSYTVAQLLGELWLTTTDVAIVQGETQSNAGGITEAYLQWGTYVKSFYTVMYAPSCSVVTTMGDKHHRMHHRIKSRNAYPCILREAVHV